MAITTSFSRTTTSFIELFIARAKALNCSFTKGKVIVGTEVVSSRLIWYVTIEGYNKYTIVLGSMFNIAVSLYLIEL